MGARGERKRPASSRKWKTGTVKKEPGFERCSLANPREVRSQNQAGLWRDANLVTLIGTGSAQQENISSWRTADSDGTASQRQAEGEMKETHGTTTRSSMAPEARGRSRNSASILLRSMHPLEFREAIIPVDRGMLFSACHDRSVPSSQPARLS